MAGVPGTNAPPQAPVSPGGVERGNLDDSTTYDGFQQARERVKQSAEDTSTAEAKTAAIQAKAEIIADEKLNQFDLDTYLKEIEGDAKDMEQSLDLAAELQYIRENGLSAEQQKQMEAIKKIVADRKEAVVAGTPASAPAQPAAQPAAQPPAPSPAPAPATVAQPVAQPVAATGAPVVDPAQPAPAPTTQMPVAEDINRIVAEQLATFKEENDQKLATLLEENTTLKTQVESHEADKKDIITQRDKLKDEKRVTEFSEAASKVNIPQDLRAAAYGIAQKIVNNDQQNPDKKALTYEEIFTLMRESHPSFFGGKADATATQIKPGATGTGTAAGGAVTPKQDSERKKAETFGEARNNLQDRVNAGTP